MYEKFKYAVGEYGDQVIAIVFPETVAHTLALDVFGSREKILGAGFGSVNGDTVVVYGKSVGLGVGSRSEQDVKLVKRAVGLGRD